MRLKLIELQSDPSSRYYRQYLANDQFAAYFAPSVATQQSVIASFDARGLPRRYDVCESWWRPLPWRSAISKRDSIACRSRTSARAART